MAKNCLKNTLICFILVFFCSCALRKLQLPTTVVDLKTGSEINENSIHLEKGKICYITSAQYDWQILDRSIFKNTQSSNFFPAKGISVDALYSGSASKSAKIDTIIKDKLIVHMALQEALVSGPNRFQHQYVPQQESIDTTGNINTQIVVEKFNPDIIVNLKSLALKMSGDANVGHSILRGEPGNVNYGSYSTATSISNHYGSILMDYTAVWEIQNLKNNTTQSIKQTGRYVSQYYDDYLMAEEVMICGKKIGKEFSSLFKNSF